MPNNQIECSTMTAKQVLNHSDSLNSELCTSILLLVLLYMSDIRNSIIKDCMQVQLRIQHQSASVLSNYSDV